MQEKIERYEGALKQISHPYLNGACGCKLNGDHLSRITRNALDNFEPFSFNTGPK